MKTLKDQIQEVLQAAFSAAFPDSPQIVQVEYCDLQFGHFASNIALQAAKELKQAPAEIAKMIVPHLEMSDQIESAEVVSPGFINIRVSPTVLRDSIDMVTVEKSGSGKKMVIDYSHPNIGKPMGVHHLLSTVIGDSIKRIYKQVGYEVIADNFIGDMGTQFGKLIHAVKTWGDMETIEKNPVPELLKLYVQFHIAADSDEALDDAGRAEYKKLEEGDPENRALLTKIQSWSMAEMYALYDELGVEFDHFNGESFYEDKIEAIIELGKSKGIFVESQGALVCMLDNPDEPPALIQKSDGTSLYLTRDLARIEYWQDTWHPDLMVNVVDVAQTLQMKQVFEVAQKLGLTPAKNVHVAFGRMQFQDGSMSTRKGNIVLVEEVITQTKSRVKDQIVSLSTDLNEHEQTDLTDLLAINAIKYNILRQNRLSNITFDWDSLLSLEGNSAPYLAYSSVRMQAIERSGESMPQRKEGESTQLHIKEVELILEVSKLNDVFGLAEKTFQPSDIANYCYEICRLYNSFYHTHKIIENGEINYSRYHLNSAVLAVVRTCFEVLGLEIPDKM